MIRLSEALARLHCEKEIKVKYVDEAKRLLKMSIISVKSSDVSLDDYDEDEGLAGGGGGGGDDDDDQGGGDGGDGGDAGEAGDGGAAEKDTEREVEETPTRRRKRAREERASPQKSPAKSPAKGAAAAAVAEAAAANAAPAKKRKLEIKQEEFDLISIRVMGLLSEREERGEEEYEQADLVNTYLDKVCVWVGGWVGVGGWVFARTQVFCARRVCAASRGIQQKIFLSLSLARSLSLSHSHTHTFLGELTARG